MPYYVFLVHGEDTRQPEGRRGFYTTRCRQAPTQEAAAEALLADLREEFTTGVSASYWSSDVPSLTINDCWRTSWLGRSRYPNRGSTFYEDTDR
jgi:hypothetical protein